MKKKEWSDAQDLPDEDLTGETCDILRLSWRDVNSSRQSLGDWTHDNFKLMVLNKFLIKNIKLKRCVFHF